MKLPKLVRDKIPEIFLQGQIGASFRTLRGDELKRAMLDKILEEAEEAKATPALEEFADIHEILLTAAAAHGFTEKQVKAAAAKKREERGGFSKGLCLMAVEPKVMEE